MDILRYAVLLALVVGAVVVTLAWRARRERARLAAIRRAQEEDVSEDEAFLDSSHISGPIPGLADRGGDAASRAAAALRGDGPPRR